LVLTALLFVDFLLSPQGSEQEIISFLPMLTLFLIVVGIWTKKKWSYIPAFLNIIGATGLLVLMLTNKLVLGEFYIAQYAAAYFVFIILEVSTIIFVVKNYPVKDEFAVIDNES
jgi:hypothetical protein